VFKLEAEDGTWLTDLRLGPPKPGDRIPRGKDTLEVVRVRHDDERDVLVVRSVHGSERVNEEALLDEVLRQSGRCRLTRAALREASVAREGGLVACRGHDMIEALKDWALPSFAETGFVGFLFF
jgi:hypothetical protein